MGYYTEVAGLGLEPGDVVIHGTVDVYNQCDAGNCIALNNFWRSLSNLTIDVAGKTGDGCHANTEFWAASQAAPMRRVVVNGAISLMDYCTGPAYASGGFIADSSFSSTVINGSQQQFFVRNSTLNGWSNGVWNQVFAGTSGAPAEQFGPATNYYTTLANTPVAQERPFLYISDGQWRVFLPSVRRATQGVSWSGDSQPGTSLPLSAFYVATPGTSAATINRALARGKNLLLEPGVYDLTSALQVSRNDAVVLGLGFATLVPQRGTSAITVTASRGATVAGLILDAGPRNSASLLQVGYPPFFGLRTGSAADPTVVQDVFFRVGGATAGKATTALTVNSSHVLLDDIWAWRADHGAGVGWTKNTSATGLVVNGDDVTATGLFVEHFQKTEVQWNGQDGRIVFFQNEMPYDVPSQSAWSAGRGVKGYPALQVGSRVRTFTGYGLGSYSFFNQGLDIHATQAFTVPRTPGVTLHHLLTVFLDGSGAIDSVVNGVGAASTPATSGQPSTVSDYPAS